MKRFLRAVSRFILGITFILSGFLKAIDPIGVSLKITEYLNAFYLGFLDFASLPAGILLAGAEFIIGVCILKGIKMQLFSRIALWFVSFFTLLTLYSAIFSPVKDCGCFGEAIHLSNWETFFKNIILLACSCTVYFQRNQFRPIASARWENIYTGCYACFILSISAYSLILLPQVDFGGFKAGTDLSVSFRSEPEMEYETTFTYSKEGKKQEFTLNNLPDSTWTFVESHTKLISASSLTSGVPDFIIKNNNGEYVTEKIVESNKPVLLLSVYNVNKIGKKRVEKIMRLRDSASAAGAVFYILSGNAPETTEERFCNTDTSNAHNPFLPEEILYTDYKTALLLNRSNGGAVYMNNGTIACKWSRCNYPIDKITNLLKEDSETVTANIIIKEHIFIELSIAFILFMILIVRFVSKQIYSSIKK